MEKVDPNQGNGGAGGAVEPNGPNADPAETTPKETAPEPNSDPLDAIEDESSRAEAKKHRAIARRLEKDGNKFDEEGNPEVEAEPEADPQEPQSEFATKDDLKTKTLSDAKLLVSDEVKEVWDELKGIPLAGYNPLDAESVAQNMIERYNIYRSRNPIDPENPAAPLQTTPRVPTPGEGGTKKKQEEELPGYKEPVEPGEEGENWYPKED